MPADNWKESENGVLNQLMRPYYPQKSAFYLPILNLAGTLVMFSEERNILAGADWFRGNRLSLHSAPGAQLQIVETLEYLVDRATEIGMEPWDTAIARAMAKALERMRGH